MNIFYLDACPHKAARSMCDKHVVKMVLETSQILCTVQRAYGNDDPILYKPTHRHHPSVRWTTESVSNYNWLFEHFIGLLNEYAFRYGRTHKCAGMVNTLMVPPLSMPRTPFTQPPPAMPDMYVTKGDSTAPLRVVESYRAYYRHGKAHLLRYTKRAPPTWI